MNYSASRSKNRDGQRKRSGNEVRGVGPLLGLEGSLRGWKDLRKTNTWWRIAAAETTTTRKNSSPEDVTPSTIHVTEHCTANFTAVASSWPHHTRDDRLAAQTSACELYARHWTCGDTWWMPQNTAETPQTRVCCKELELGLGLVRPIGLG